MKPLVMNINNINLNNDIRTQRFVIELNINWWYYKCMYAFLIIGDSQKNETNVDEKSNEAIRSRGVKGYDTKCLSFIYGLKVSRVTVSSV